MRDETASAETSGAETVRLTEQEAQTNVRAVLQLCASGKLRSSEKTRRIDAIKGQRSANVLTAVKPRRQTVAEALAGCPVGEWVTVEDLFTTMRRGNLSPTIARSERGLWKLYLVDPEYGSLGWAGFAEWPILEGRYTLCVLFEYAATLGLTDTYRTTHVTEQILRVLPNLDIVAVGEVHVADRLVLDAYAERTSDRVWSLTATSLLAAWTRAGRWRSSAAFWATAAPPICPRPSPPPSARDCEPSAMPCADRRGRSGSTAAVPSRTPRIRPARRWCSLRRGGRRRAG